MVNLRIISKTVRELRIRIPCGIGGIRIGGYLVWLGIGIDHYWCWDWY